MWPFRIHILLHNHALAQYSRYIIQNIRTFYLHLYTQAVIALQHSNGTLTHFTIIKCMASGFGTHFHAMKMLQYILIQQI